MSINNSFALLLRRRSISLSLSHAHLRFAQAKHVWPHLPVFTQFSVTHNFRRCFCAAQNKLHTYTMHRMTHGNPPKCGKHLNETEFFHMSI